MFQKEVRSNIEKIITGTKKITEDMKEEQNICVLNY